VLTDFQIVNTLGNLGVLAWLLNSRTEIGVSLIVARGFDNLGRWDGAVGVNPVAPSPTVGGGGIDDLFAIATSRCR
jgi:hypothetical protein